MKYSTLLGFLTSKYDQQNGYRHIRKTLYDQEISGPLLRSHLHKLLLARKITLWLRNPQDNNTPMETVPHTFTFLNINYVSCHDTESPIPKMSLTNYALMRGMTCQYPELPPIVCKSVRTNLIICIPIEHIDVIIEGDDETALDTIRTHGKRWKPNIRFSLDSQTNKEMVETVEDTVLSILEEEAEQELVDTTSHEMSMMMKEEPTYSKKLN